MALLDWTPAGVLRDDKSTMTPSALYVNAGFTPLPSNRYAMNLAESFVAGRLSALAVGGPSGCGKSVFLETVACAVGERLGRDVLFAASTDFARSLQRPGQRIESVPCLILDDYQDTKHALRARLNGVIDQRVRRGLPTIVGETRRTPARRAALPFSERWETIWLPAPQGKERETLVRNLANLMRLNLDETLICVLAYRLGGNQRAIMGALQRLALTGNDWRGRGRTLVACGRIMPLLPMTAGWDPRDAFSEAVGELLATASATERQNWIAWSLLRGAHFAECDVAGYLDCDAGEVFLMAQAAILPLSSREIERRWSLVKARVFDLIAAGCQK